jgi:hypothetical protein
MRELETWQKEILTESETTNRETHVQLGGGGFLVRVVGGVYSTMEHRLVEMIGGRTTPLPPRTMVGGL